MLAQMSLLAYYSSVSAEVVDETTCDIRPTFFNVVTFEADGIEDGRKTI